MNLAIRDNRSTHIFLAGLLIALLPYMLFLYLAFVFLMIKVFFIACIIDYITKNSIRIKIAAVLVPSLIACIAALIISYLFY